MHQKICSFFVIFCATVSTCSPQQTKINGQWGEWKVGKCSVTCGEGLRARYRKCDNPAPSGGGSKCLGSSLEHDTCTLAPCPINGGWNDWSAWSPCSGSCGIGVRRRRRSCKAPSPLHGGKLCEGPSEQTEACDSELVQPCPQDGGWSDWIPFLPCPSDIGEVCRHPHKHQQVRQRFCTNPAPSYGGKTCDGSDFEYSPCSELYQCSTGGRWSDWIRGSCSVTCGVGLEVLTRKCLDDGISRNCSGPIDLVQECKMPPCRVDGGWSSWHEKKSCRASQVEDPCSGSGPDDDDVRILERYCNNPPPSGRGITCQGDRITIEKCRQVYGCPDRSQQNDTLWSDWEFVGSCGVTCGKGLQMTRRTCLDESGECSGPSQSVATCEMPPCQSTQTLPNLRSYYTITVGDFSVRNSENSGEILAFPPRTGFSQWTEWSGCDVQTCKQTRWRLCQNEHGGCYGNDVETRTCANPTDLCLTAALRATATSGAALIKNIPTWLATLLVILLSSRP